MGKVTDIAERMWNGDTGDHNVHAQRTAVEFELIDEGLGSMSAFSNVLAVETDEGLVFIDTSSVFHAFTILEKIREWTDKRVHTAVYTHGHVDHVFGLGPFEEEAKKKNQPKTRVIAHEACPRRFDRYILTNGYNGIINWRQFRFVEAPIFPKHYRYPDETFSDQRTIDVGGVRFDLFHDKGETDDHVWAWIPSHEAIYTGDLFIWAAPNCGNPQKTQRYPREWAAGFRKMVELRPERLFPGHGPPILGADRVRQALTESAELLETIVEQTLEMMNSGAPLNTILHEIDVPDRLLQRPYLRPVYDDPSFIVRNLWRLYGGWYDGNPSHLKPARDRDLAVAVAEAAGGAKALARRAEKAAADGDLAVACHLAEFAGRAEPDDETVRRIRAAVYRARVAEETSLMAKSIFRAAAEDSEKS